MAPGKQLIVMAVLMIMIQRILASCPLCWHGVGAHCGPTPNCSYGVTWSSNCDCCYECKKGPGESCGGAWGQIGTCGSDLECKNLICNDYNCWDEVGICLDPEQGIGHLFWLGGSDISEEGQWKWTDGQPIEMRQFPWRYPEPIGNENENCLEWNGYWFSDAPCQKQLKYICELDAMERATTKEPTPTEVNTEINKEASTDLPTEATIEIKYYEHESGMVWLQPWCSYIGYGFNSSSLHDCLNNCSTNNHCTAVTYNNARRLCSMESCPVPAPQPSYSDPDWIAYSLRNVEINDNDYCNDLGGIHIEGKCLIISEEELDWEEASKACNSKGGQLASLQGFREFQLVKYFISSMHENTTMSTITSREKDFMTDSPEPSSSSSSNISASEP